MQSDPKLESGDTERNQMGTVFRLRQPESNCVNKVLATKSNTKISSFCSVLSEGPFFQGFLVSWEARSLIVFIIRVLIRNCTSGSGETIRFSQREHPFCHSSFTRHWSFKNGTDGSKSWHRSFLRITAWSCYTIMSIRVFMQYHCHLWLFEQPNIYDTHRWWRSCRHKLLGMGGVTSVTASQNHRLRWLEYSILRPISGRFFPHCASKLQQSDQREWYCSPSTRKAVEYVRPQCKDHLHASHQFWRIECRWMATCWFVCGWCRRVLATDGKELSLVIV